jgi:23S rRNA (uracil1939-C5)-methyltransferase
MSFKKRKKTLPTEPVRTLIQSLTHDGRGVTRIEGKPVFIEGALPGEDVTFLYTDIRRDFAEGKITEIHTASVGRVTPLCASFGVCGGCSFQHVADSVQIGEKQSLLVEQFERIGKLSAIDLFPPLTGPSWGYRHKARLGVKYVAKKGRVLVGFRERSTPFLADIDTCHVLHPKVGLHLRDLGELIARLTIRDRLPQIEVAVGEHRISMVFRVLEDPTTEDLAILKEGAIKLGFDCFLQRHGPDSIVALHPVQPVRPTYSIQDHSIDFQFEPTDFIQVNPEINRKMINRVIDLLDLKPNDKVLDLFCGIGNFTLPIARHAAFVTGIEGGSEAVKRAYENAEANGIQNIEFHVADLTQPLEGKGWADQSYDKILMDPSRAGAEDVLSAIPRWSPSSIVYVSCNPSTLARDAGILVTQHGYKLIRAGVMDMFPQTAHVESIALFQR